MTHKNPLPLSDAEKCRKLATWLDPYPRYDRSKIQGERSRVGLNTITESSFAGNPFCTAACDFPNDAAACMALKRALARHSYDIDVLTIHGEELGGAATNARVTRFGEEVSEEINDNEPRAVFDAIWAAFEKEVSDD